MLRVGVDENGLGAQLGPLIVTCVWAEVTRDGQKALARKLPQAQRKDLDDSKALVSCQDVSLGEAWARVIASAQGETPAASPRELLRRLLRESEKSLRTSCPKQSESQCWSTRHERFVADDDVLARLSGHLRTLEKRGVRVLGALTEVVCTKRLTDQRRAGVHRFAADLHAMERLLLTLRERRDEDLLAICGKVGGIGQYERFFGPLAGRLRTVLAEGRDESRYHFPGLGELRFLRDADARDPLVMLASLVGKYVRELLMNRISNAYPEVWAERLVSGYHDPVTERFIQATQHQRRRLRVAEDCFIRSREEVTRTPPAPRETGPQRPPGSRHRSSQESRQGKLF